MASFYIALYGLDYNNKGLVDAEWQSVSIACRNIKNPDNIISGCAGKVDISYLIAYPVLY